MAATLLCTTSVQWALRLSTMGPARTGLTVLEPQEDQPSEQLEVSLVRSSLQLARDPGSARVRSYGCHGVQLLPSEVACRDG